MKAGQEGAAGALSKGQSVTMRGRVSGLILLSVIVKDCEIVPASRPAAAPAQPARAPAATPQPRPAPPAAPPRKK